MTMPRAPLFLALLTVPTLTAAQTTPPARIAPPATLAQVTMSPENTKRAHLQEINLDTAIKLANACVAYSREHNATGGATVVVVSAPAGWPPLARTSRATSTKQTVTKRNSARSPPRESPGSTMR